MICYYWFFNHDFKYQDYVCNACHDLLMQCINTCDIAVIIVIGVDYHCIIHVISKPDTIKLLKKLVLNDCGYI